MAHVPEAANAIPIEPAGEMASAALERPKSNKRAPEFEIALGARIRAARVATGMSQTALGEAVGISFQQVQKYEQGKDRVAASTLQAIAAVLDVHPGSFFDDGGLAPTGRVPKVREAMAVAADWQRIGNPETRKGIATLIATLAGESQGERED